MNPGRVRFRWRIFPLPTVALSENRNPKMNILWWTMINRWTFGLPFYFSNKPHIVGMFHILIEDPLPFFFTAKIDPSIDSFERPWFVRGGAPKKWCDGSGNGKTIRTTANWLGKLWEIWKHMDHMDHNGINHDISSFFSNKLSYTS